VAAGAAERWQAQGLDGLPPLLVESWRRRVSAVVVMAASSANPKSSPKNAKMLNAPDGLDFGRVELVAALEAGEQTTRSM
jgi:hypothetical protein